MEPRPRSIAILTAEVGEGHLAAARALAEEVRAAAPDVEVVFVDALDAFGPILRLLLLDAYRFQLRHTPRVFHALFWLFLHVRPLRALGRGSLVALGGRGLSARIERLGPDVVVSTYPAATSVLGTLRRRGTVTVPALATVTDFAGVQFWSHPGIDLHLVMHPSLVAPVEREAGKGSACVVAPLAARAFREAAGRRGVARERLALPGSDRVIVVSGGGWGVGDIAGAVAEASALPATTVVVVTGRNSVLETRLRAAYRDCDRVRVLGFTEDMPDLLAAADLVVHTTGGVTCLEAFAAGCPLVAYGAPAGHAPALARAMARQKVALHARSRAELRQALLSPLPARELEEAPSAAECLLSPRPRAHAPARRGPAFPALVAAALVVVCALLAVSRTAFAVIAMPLDLSPATTIATRQNDVALVVDVPSTAIPHAVRLLAHSHASASFVISQFSGRRLQGLLASHHDQTISILSRPGIDDWLGAMHSVRLVRGQRFVLAPRGGISIAQYLLADLAGARLIAPTGKLERGAVVLSQGGSLDRLLAAIAAHGLRAAPIAALSTAKRHRGSGT